MNTLIGYAMSFVGLPYRWGGDDPMSGFDCSGLVQEILASVGEDPPGDQTADALFRYFLNRGTLDRRRAGSLAFFGRLGNGITHVGFMIDSWRMIEAAGGGSTTRTLKDATRQNAYIRIRPLNRRVDLVKVILPDYRNII